MQCVYLFTDLSLNAFVFLVYIHRIMMAFSKIIHSDKYAFLWQCFKIKGSLSADVCIVWPLRCTHYPYILPDVSPDGFLYNKR